jgi:hypothetical protein
MRRVDPRTIKLLDVNARFMKHEQYQQLVRNVRRDGDLTSVPLCWIMPDGRLEVLSGNHRTLAAIDADLAEIDVKVLLDPIPDKQRIAIQISHNSIEGEDDPATLKQLYDSLDDIDLRAYSGVDDRTLDLLQQVDVGSLADVNLDYSTVQIVFLPPELMTVKEVLDDAKKSAPADERWVATLSQHTRLLDALGEARDSFNIGNIATAFAIILGIYEQHRDDLREGYIGPDGEATHKGWAPLTTLLGRGTIPAAAAAVVNRAIQAMVGREEIPADKPWQALEYWAADYLAGPQDGQHLGLPAAGEPGFLQHAPTVMSVNDLPDVPPAGFSGSDQ